jgi:hypothetical protein
MMFVGGNDGRVIMLHKGQFTDLGMFEWGIKPATPLCIKLARVLLHAAFPGDSVRAQKNFMLFRTHMEREGKWKRGQAWGLRYETILAMVEDIERKQEEFGPMLRQMARELPMVQASGPQFPGSSGYGTNDSAPDRKRR